MSSLRSRAVSSWTLNLCLSICCICFLVELEMPEASSHGGLSVGMTPKTLRLPKHGEMLLSVHGSPLGVYKEDMEAIHGALHIVNPVHEASRHCSVRKGQIDGRRLNHSLPVDVVTFEVYTTCQPTRAMLKYAFAICLYSS
ncbi:hypothetical protein CsSME_00032568 [Camellia sinensis var. sinensis]